MNIEHISISRKAVFDLCPCQYRFKYHLKTKVDEPSPFYFVYGNIVHRIAEEYIKQRGKTPLNEIAKKVLKGEIPIVEYGGVVTVAPQLPKDYAARLPIHLEAIEKLTRKIGTDGDTEWEFKYDLDPPHHRLFTGVIDRHIKKDNKIWIIDYKTTKPGRWRKNDKTVTGDLQLRAYARVVQREYKVPAENIMAALYYLEPPSKLVAAKFTDKTLLTAEKELLDTYKKIESADPKKVWGNVGEHCNRCEFRKICPHLKGMQTKEQRLIGFGL